MMPRVAFFGVGGIGGWLGARLTESKAADVVLIARGVHGVAIREKGLSLVVRSGGDSGPVEEKLELAPDAVEVYETVKAAVDAAAQPVDYVILCVKTWQVREAAAEALPLLAPGGCVVTTQNGVEAVHEAAAAIGPEHVMGGICKVLAFIASPGVVEMQIQPAFFNFGEVLDRHGVVTHSPSSDRAEKLASLLGACKGTNSGLTSASFWVAMWEKAVIMCSMGPVAALCRADLHTVCKVPETKELLRQAMLEIGHCAAAAGHLAEGMTSEALAERTIAHVSQAKPGVTPSTLRDVVMGKPSELNELTGGIRRAGQKFKVPTPTHDMIFAALLPQEKRARREEVYQLMGVPGGAPHTPASL